MSELRRRVAVTGGAGFIGSNLLLHLVPRYPEYLFVNIDSLTYAGNLRNLSSLEDCKNYRFEKLDICEQSAVLHCFERHQIDSVLHLAAESHVDRSIDGPMVFVLTNVVGTANLLEAALARHRQSGRFRFLHVSTDEVYGSLGQSGFFAETTPYNPNSPYSASKAAADHLVRAYHKTYGMDTVTTNCSNNYGRYQFPEKLIPLMIRNAREGLKLPVYGDGLHVRDWLYVEDHCRALDIAFHKGKAGETYNIGGDSELTNIELVKLVCESLDDKLGGGPRERLIEFVTDRPGHDRRYAIDASKIKRELGWMPSVSFEEGLDATIKWYLDHQVWLEECISGEYKNYYAKMYANR
ncbi:MAG: dTDP-glucose 4,6-dehydratase [candidate division Zixibacteria bacterium]|nr:dTDP-glucose 4,6-dehydratase [candidate division Zixibacteria bacterium]MDH3938057.1 dTDP-glucose 4,6-dehydratase [candidate division Zixibacteria bacterium]